MLRDRTSLADDLNNLMAGAFEKSLFVLVNDIHE